MRVTVTGASGLIGTALVAELRAHDLDVTVLSRKDPSHNPAAPGVEALRWDPLSEPAPVAALAGRDAVIHLAGENVAQRWTEQTKRAIRESRVTGTRNLLAGLEATGRSELGQRPRTLISGSAIGYYGAHGDEPLDEDAPPGSDFLAETCVAWEAEAMKASALGMRVAQMRTGVVLDREGGALKKMLPPFRLGIGGPVAGGGQYMSWIHREDLIGMIGAALEDERWAGPINGTAPEPVRNREFSHALGHALHRPSLLPVPGFALGLLYGEMAEMLTTGARVMPAKPLVLGYRFRHPRLDEALLSALG